MSEEAFAAIVGKERFQTLQNSADSSHAPNQEQKQSPQSDGDLIAKLIAQARTTVSMTKREYVGRPASHAANSLTLVPNLGPYMSEHRRRRMELMEQQQQQEKTDDGANDQVGVDGGNNITIHNSASPSSSGNNHNYRRHSFTSISSSSLATTPQQQEKVVDRNNNNVLSPSSSLTPRRPQTATYCGYLQSTPKNSSNTPTTHSTTEINQSSNKNNNANSQQPFLRGRRTMFSEETSNNNNNTNSVNAYGHHHVNNFQNSSSPSTARTNTNASSSSSSLPVYAAFLRNSNMNNKVVVKDVADDSPSPISHSETDSNNNNNSNNNNQTEISELENPQADPSSMNATTARADLTKTRPQEFHNNNNNKSNPVRSIYADRSVSPTTSRHYYPDQYIKQQEHNALSNILLQQPQDHQHPNGMNNNSVSQQQSPFLHSISAATAVGAGDSLSKTPPQQNMNNENNIHFPSIPASPEKNNHINNNNSVDVGIQADLFVPNGGNQLYANLMMYPGMEDMKPEAFEALRATRRGTQAPGLLLSNNNNNNSSIDEASGSLTTTDSHTVNSNSNNNNNNGSSSTAKKTQLRTKAAGDDLNELIEEDTTKIADEDEVDKFLKNNNNNHNNASEIQDEDDDGDGSPIILHPQFPESVSVTHNTLLKVASEQLTSVDGWDQGFFLKCEDGVNVGGNTFQTIGQHPIHKNPSLVQQTPFLDIESSVRISSSNNNNNTTNFGYGNTNNNNNNTNSNGGSLHVYKDWIFLVEPPNTTTTSPLNSLESSPFREISMTSHLISPLQNNNNKRGDSKTSSPSQQQAAAAAPLLPLRLLRVWLVASVSSIAISEQRTNDQHQQPAPGVRDMIKQVMELPSSFPGLLLLGKTSDDSSSTSAMAVPSAASSASQAVAGLVDMAATSLVSFWAQPAYINNEYYLEKRKRMAKKAKLDEKRRRLAMMNASSMSPANGGLGPGGRGGLPKVVDRVQAPQELDEDEDEVDDGDDNNNSNVNASGDFASPNGSMSNKNSATRNQREKHLLVDAPSELIRILAPSDQVVEFVMQADAAIIASSLALAKSVGFVMSSANNRNSPTQQQEVDQGSVNNNNNNKESSHNNNNSCINPFVTSFSISSQHRPKSASGQFGAVHSLLVPTQINGNTGESTDKTASLVRPASATAPSRETPNPHAGTTPNSIILQQRCLEPFVAEIILLPQMEQLVPLLSPQYMTTDLANIQTLTTAATEAVDLVETLDTYRMNIAASTPVLVPKIVSQISQQHLQPQQQMLHVSSSTSSSTAGDSIIDSKNGVFRYGQLVPTQVPAGEPIVVACGGVIADRSILELMLTLSNSTTTAAAGSGDIIGGNKQRGDHMDKNSHSNNNNNNITGGTKSVAGNPSRKQGNNSVSNMHRVMQSNTTSGGVTSSLASAAYDELSQHNSEYMRDGTLLDHVATFLRCVRADVLALSPTSDIHMKQQKVSSSSTTTTTTIIASSTATSTAAIPPSNSSASLPPLASTTTTTTTLTAATIKNTITLSSLLDAAFTGYCPPNKVASALAAISSSNAQTTKTNTSYASPGICGTALLCNHADTIRYLHDLRDEVTRREAATAEYLHLMKFAAVEGGDVSQQDLYLGEVGIVTAAGNAKSPKNSTCDDGVQFFKNSSSIVGYLPLMQDHHQQQQQMNNNNKNIARRLRPVNELSFFVMNRQQQQILSIISMNMKNIPQQNQSITLNKNLSSTNNMINQQRKRATTMIVTSSPTGQNPSQNQIRSFGGEEVDASASNNNINNNNATDPDDPFSKRNSNVNMSNNPGTHVSQNNNDNGNEDLLGGHESQFSLLPVHTLSTPSGDVAFIAIVGHRYKDALETAKQIRQKQREHFYFTENMGNNNNNNNEIKTVSPDQQQHESSASGKHNSTPATHFLPGQVVQPPPRAIVGVIQSTSITAAEVLAFIMMRNENNNTNESSASFPASDASLQGDWRENFDCILGPSIVDSENINILIAQHVQAQFLNFSASVAAMTNMMNANNNNNNGGARNAGAANNHDNNIDDEDGDAVDQTSMNKNSTAVFSSSVNPYASGSYVAASKRDQRNQQLLQAIYLNGSISPSNVGALEAIHHKTSTTFPPITTSDPTPTTPRLIRRRGLQNPQEKPESSPRILSLEEEEEEETRTSLHNNNNNSKQNLSTSESHGENSHDRNAEELNDSTRSQNQKPGPQTIPITFESFLDEFIATHLDYNFYVPCPSALNDAMTIRLESVFEFYYTSTNHHHHQSNTTKSKSDNNSKLNSLNASGRSDDVDYGNNVLQHDLVSSPSSQRLSVRSRVRVTFVSTLKTLRGHSNSNNSSNNSKQLQKNSKHQMQSASLVITPRTSGNTDKRSASPQPFSPSKNNQMIPNNNNYLNQSAEVMTQGNRSSSRSSSHNDNNDTMFTIGRGQHGVTSDGNPSRHRKKKKTITFQDDVNANTFTASKTKNHNSSKFNSSYEEGSNPNEDEDDENNNNNEAGPGTNITSATNIQNRLHFLHSISGSGGDTKKIHRTFKETNIPLLLLTRRKQLLVGAVSSGKHNHKTDGHDDEENKRRKEDGDTTDDDDDDDDDEAMIGFVKRGNNDKTKKSVQQQKSLRSLGHHYNQLHARATLLKRTLEWACSRVAKSITGSIGRFPTMRKQLAVNTQSLTGTASNIFPHHQQIGLDEHHNDEILPGDFRIHVVSTFIANAIVDFFSANNLQSVSGNQNNGETGNDDTFGKRSNNDLNNNNNTNASSSFTKNNSNGSTKKSENESNNSFHSASWIHFGTESGAAFCFLGPESLDVNSLASSSEDVNALRVLEWCAREKKSLLREQKQQQQQLESVMNAALKTTTAAARQTGEVTYITVSPAAASFAMTNAGGPSSMMKRGTTSPQTQQRQHQDSNSVFFAASNNTAGSNSSALHVSSVNHLGLPNIQIPFSSSSTSHQQNNFLSDTNCNVVASHPSHAAAAAYSPITLMPPRSPIPSQFASHNFAAPALNPSSLLALHAQSHFFHSSNALYSPTSFGLASPATLNTTAAALAEGGGGGRLLGNNDINGNAGWHQNTNSQNDTSLFSPLAMEAGPRSVSFPQVHSPISVEHDINLIKEQQHRRQNQLSAMCAVERAAILKSLSVHQQNVFSFFDGSNNNTSSSSPINNKDNYHSSTSASIAPSLQFLMNSIRVASVFQNVQQQQQKQQELNGNNANAPAADSASFSSFAASPLLACNFVSSHLGRYSADSTFSSSTFIELVTLTDMSLLPHFFDTCFKLPSMKDVISVAKNKMTSSATFAAGETSPINGNTAKPKTSTNSLGLQLFASEQLSLTIHYDENTKAVKVKHLRVNETLVVGEDGLGSSLIDDDDDDDDDKEEKEENQKGKTKKIPKTKVHIRFAVNTSLIVELLSYLFAQVNSNGGSHSNNSSHENHSASFSQSDNLNNTNRATLKKDRLLFESLHRSSLRPHLLAVIIIHKFREMAKQKQLKSSEQQQEVYAGDVVASTANNNKQDNSNQIISAKAVDKKNERRLSRSLSNLHRRDSAHGALMKSAVNNTSFFGAHHPANPAFTASFNPNINNNNIGGGGGDVLKRRQTMSMIRNTLPGMLSASPTGNEFVRRGTVRIFGASQIHQNAGASSSPKNNSNHIKGIPSISFNNAKVYDADADEFWNDDDDGADNDENINDKKMDEFLNNTLPGTTNSATNGKNKDSGKVLELTNNTNNFNNNTHIHDWMAQSWSIIRHVDQQNNNQNNGFVFGEGVKSEYGNDQGGDDDDDDDDDDSGSNHDNANGEVDELGDPPYIRNQNKNNNNANQKSSRSLVPAGTKPNSNNKMNSSAIFGNYYGSLFVPATTPRAIRDRLFELEKADLDKVPHYALILAIHCTFIARKVNNPKLALEEQQKILRRQQQQQLGADGMTTATGARKSVFAISAVNAPPIPFAVRVSACFARLLSKESRDQLSTLLSSDNPNAAPSTAPPTTSSSSLQDDKNVKKKSPQVKTGGGGGADGSSPLSAAAAAIDDPLKQKALSQIPTKISCKVYLVDADAEELSMLTSSTAVSAAIRQSCERLYGTVEASVAICMFPPLNTESSLDKRRKANAANNTATSKDDAVVNMGAKSSNNNNNSTIEQSNIKQQKDILEDDLDTESTVSGLDGPSSLSATKKLQNTQNQEQFEKESKMVQHAYEKRVVIRSSNGLAIPLVHQATEEVVAVIYLHKEVNFVDTLLFLEEQGAEGLLKQEQQKTLLQQTSNLNNNNNINSNSKQDAEVASMAMSMAVNGATGFVPPTIKQYHYNKLKNSPFAFLFNEVTGQLDREMIQEAAKFSREECFMAVAIQRQLARQLFFEDKFQLYLSAYQAIAELLEAFRSLSVTASANVIDVLLVRLARASTRVLSCQKAVTFVAHSPGNVMTVDHTATATTSGTGQKTKRKNAPHSPGGGNETDKTSGQPQQQTIRAKRLVCPVSAFGEEVSKCVGLGRPLRLDHSIFAPSSSFAGTASQQHNNSNPDTNHPQLQRRRSSIPLHALPSASNFNNQNNNNNNEVPEDEEEYRRQQYERAKHNAKLLDSIFTTLKQSEHEAARYVVKNITELTSLLIVPLVHRDREATRILGVSFFVNHTSRNSDTVIPFTNEDEQFALAFSQLTARLVTANREMQRLSDYGALESDRHTRLPLLPQKYKMYIPQNTLEEKLGKLFSVITKTANNEALANRLVDPRMATRNTASAMLSAAEHQDKMFKAAGLMLSAFQANPQLQHQTAWMDRLRLEITPLDRPAKATSRQPRQMAATIEAQPLFELDDDDDDDDVGPASVNPGSNNYSFALFAPPKTAITDRSYLHNNSLFGTSFSINHKDSASNNNFFATSGSKNPGVNPILSSNSSGSQQQQKPLLMELDELKNNNNNAKHTKNIVSPPKGLLQQQQPASNKKPKQSKPVSGADEEESAGAGTWFEDSEEVNDEFGKDQYDDTELDTDFDIGGGGGGGGSEREKQDTLPSPKKSKPKPTFIIESEKKSKLDQVSADDDESTASSFQAAIPSPPKNNHDNNSNNYNNLVKQNSGVTQQPQVKHQMSSLLKKNDTAPILIDNVNDDDEDDEEEYEEFMLGGNNNNITREGNNNDDYEETEGEYDVEFVL